MVVLTPAFQVLLASILTSLALLSVPRGVVKSIWSMLEDSKNATYDFMFADGDTAAPTDTDSAELDIDAEPPPPSVTPEEDQGLVRAPAPDLIDATNVPVPTHAEVRETHTVTLNLKTEALNVLLDSLESVPPTCQPELSQTTHEIPAGTLSQVPLRDTLTANSLSKGRSLPTSGKEVIHLGDSTGRSPAGLDGTLVGCIVLLLAGLCTGALLRHKIATRRRLESTTLKPSVGKGSGTRRSTKQAAYKPSVPFKPFPSCLPPTNVEEARHTNCVYFVPSTEEDIIRSRRSSTLSFLREAPFGAPAPHNGTLLFMERRARPLWQYPPGHDASTMVNIPIPQAAIPAIYVANNGVSGTPNVNTVTPNTVTPAMNAAQPSAATPPTTSAAPKVPVVPAAPVAGPSKASAQRPVAASNASQAGPSNVSQAQSANAGRLLFDRQQHGREGSASNVAGAAVKSSATLDDNNESGSSANDRWGCEQVSKQGGLLHADKSKK